MNATRFVLGTSALLLTLTTPTFSQGAALPGVIQDAYIKAVATDSGDKLGSAIAISGDTLVIGVPGDDSAFPGTTGSPFDNSLSYSGGAYVYIRKSTGWALQAFLKASNPDMFDSFGESVAIDGDTIVVGAPLERSDGNGVGAFQGDNSQLSAGAVYIFKRTGLKWSQEAYVKASNSSWGAQFGTGVAISGDSVVVGAPGEGSSATGVGGSQFQDGTFNAGAAYVYHRVGSTWAQQAYLKASNTNADDRFGAAVDMDGDRILVGAPRESSNAKGIDGDQTSDIAAAAGAAYLFDRTGATWAQTAYVKASNTAANDEFGRAVSISADTFVVGAPYEDSAGKGVGAGQLSNTSPGSGAAYAFTKSAGLWSQDVYIKASNTAANARFTWSMVLEGDRLFVGSPGEMASFNGVDGNKEIVGLLPSSGAAYLFERTAGTWKKRTHMKAALRGDYDLFGQAVGLSGSLAVVGAPDEDSNAVGVGGNPADESAALAGASYAFDLAATCGSFRYGEYKDANVADLYCSSMLIVGNSIVLELSDFDSAGTGVALLAISNGYAQASAFGGTVHLDLAQLSLGPAGILPIGITAGAGQLTLPLPVGLGGITFFAQAAMVDPSQSGGLALSNGLQIVICP